MQLSMLRFGGNFYHHCKPTWLPPCCCKSFGARSPLARCCWRGSLVRVGRATWEAHGGVVLVISCWALAELSLLGLPELM